HVFAVADHLSKQPFGDRASANVTGTDKKNVFHHGRVAPDVRVFQPKVDRSQVNWAKSGIGLVRVQRQPGKSRVSALLSVSVFTQGTQHLKHCHPERSRRISPTWVRYPAFVRSALR